MILILKSLTTEAKRGVPCMLVHTYTQNYYYIHSLFHHRRRRIRYITRFRAGPTERPAEDCDHHYSSSPERSSRPEIVISRMGENNEKTDLLSLSLASPVVVAAILNSANKISG